LRLAILNACEGARADRTDPFAGTAQSLVQQGIPAVIAMQFEITDQAAIAFAHEFYEAISDNYPVDAALTEARKTLFGMGHGLEWGTPVLYLRAPNGRIFDVQRSAEADRRAEVASLVWNANQAMEQEQWQQSIELWQSVLAKEPANAEATAKIAEARRNQQLVALLDEGRVHLNAGRVNEALEALQRVRSTAGTNFRGVEALIAEAQQKQRSAFPATQTDQLRSQQNQQQTQPQQSQPQLAVLYNEAQAAVAAEDWQRAIQRWQAILSIDPNNAQAKGGLDYSQKQERLSAAYEDGLNKFRNRNWPEALTAFRWVRNNSGVTPYKQVESYIQQSEQAIAAAEAQTHQLNNATTYNTNTNTGPHQMVAPPIVTPAPVPVPRPSNTGKVVAITAGVVLTVCVGITLIIGLLNKPASDGGSNGGVGVLPTDTPAQVIVGTVPTDTPDLGIDPTDTPEQPAPTDTVAESVPTDTPAGALPTDTAVVDLGDLTTYTAPAGYFTIGYPSGWSVTEGTDTVAFTSPARDAVYVAGASPVNVTLDEAGLLSATKTSLQNVFSGAAISTNDSLATSGAGFASVGFTIIFQGKTYYGGAVGQQHGNIFYLTAQASESSATSNYLTIFGKMTSSFHYTTR
jgi:tetratricopeptide (TPR) repeat protein